MICGINAKSLLWFIKWWSVDLQHVVTDDYMLHDVLHGLPLAETIWRAASLFEEGMMALVNFLDVIWKYFCILKFKTTFRD